jgi:hypothetical protein
MVQEVKSPVKILVSSDVRRDLIPALRVKTEWSYTTAPPYAFMQCRVTTATFLPLLSIRFHLLFLHPFVITLHNVLLLSV